MSKHNVCHSHFCIFFYFFKHIYNCTTALFYNFLITNFKFKNISSHHTNSLFILIKIVLNPPNSIGLGYTYIFEWKLQSVKYASYNQKNEIENLKVKAHNIQPYQLWLYECHIKWSGTNLQATKFEKINLSYLIWWEDLLRLISQVHVWNLDTVLHVNLWDLILTVVTCYVNQIPPSSLPKGINMIDIFTF